MKYLNKSKVNALLLIITILVFSALNIKTGLAYNEVTQNGIVFDKDTGTIVDYTGNAAELSIPQVIDGVNVTRIGDFAFHGSVNLKHVVIPEGVVSIGDSSFESCVNLTSQVLPNSLTTLGSSAFSGCVRLNGIRIPEGITEIKDYTFNGCNSLANIRFPQSITSIGKYAVGNSRCLTSIYIPQNVSFIDDSAFYSQSGLTSAYLYGDAPTAKFSIFDNSEDIITIYYPDTKTGYTNPWEGCKTVPLNPEDMPDYPPNDEIYGVSGDYEYWVFDGKAIITDYRGSGGEINIPSTLDGYPVDVIANRVFYERSDITSVVIPYGITRIGMQSFYKCSIENLIIPDSVEVIDFQAFLNCESLESIVFPSSLKRIENSLCFYSPSLRYVTIPEGVESIGDSAFYAAPLASITIPSSVTSIESLAFSATYPDKAFFMGNAPKMGEGAFKFSDEFGNKFTIYYLEGCSGFDNPWHGYKTVEHDFMNLFGSQEYNINRSNGFINNIPLGTMIQELVANLSNRNEDLIIHNNEDIQYSDFVTTGLTISLNVNGTLKEQLKTVVLGDADGDGVISITDYTLTRLDILGLRPLEDEFKAAVDIDGDGDVTITDYTLLRLDILGLKPIHPAN